MGQWLTHREVGIHDTTILTVNWNTSSKFFGGSCGCVERAPDPAQEGVTWPWPWEETSTLIVRPAG